MRIERLHFGELPARAVADAVNDFRGKSGGPKIRKCWLHAGTLPEPVFQRFARPPGAVDDAVVVPEFRSGFHQSGAELVPFSHRVRMIAAEVGAAVLQHQAEFRLEVLADELAAKRGALDHVQAAEQLRARDEDRQARATRYLAEGGRRFAQGEEVRLEERRFRRLGVIELGFGQLGIGEQALFQRQVVTVKADDKLRKRSRESFGSKTGSRSSTPR
mgnify:CR=1 FL=1